MPGLYLSDLQQLPPPLSGKQEVYFRRFLQKCYERVNEDDFEWKRNPVFHKYVEELQDRLAELRNNVKMKLSEGVVSKYVQFVEQLSEGLLTADVPLYCKKLPNRASASAASSYKPRILKPSTSHAAASATPGKLNRLVQQSILDTDAKNRLETQSQIQESLTDELVQMARGLKKRTVTMETALQRRDAVMDHATDALEFSSEAAKKASKGAAKQYKSSGPDIMTFSASEPGVTL